MPIEREIRLIATATATLEGVLNDPLVRAAALGEPRDASFVATYYDTPRRELLANRLAFRARFANGRWRAGIKGNGAVVDGVSIREEWEQEFSGPLERFGDLPPGVVRERILAITPPHTPLTPLMVTAIQRQVVLLTLPDLEGGSCRAELALDAGTVAAGGREVAIWEVEVEALEERFEPVRHFAAALQQRHPLTPAHHSKFTLGLALL